jgi:hypothetical protein
MGLFLHAHGANTAVMTIADAKNARKSLIFAEYLPSINFSDKTLNQALQFFSLTALKVKKIGNLQTIMWRRDHTGLPYRDMTGAD